MELDSCLASVALLFVLVINGSVCETPITENDALYKTLVQKMNDIQNQIAEVTKSMKILNAEIGNVLFSCSEKDNFICDVLKINPGLDQEKDQNYPLGTMKRSAAGHPPFARHRRFYRDLLRKRAMTNHLLSVLRGADSVLKDETKRTCDLNLGFHCETEAISDFADMYDFLSSENSPGKKRSNVAFA